MPNERKQIIKGKRYRTEDKIHVLREADGVKSIVEVFREKNLSEVTSHRWKKQFGQMDLNEAKRLRELERENTELKKMLAEALLAKRVLEYVVEKNYEPWTQKTDGGGRGERLLVLWAGGLSHPTTNACYIVVSSGTPELMHSSKWCSVYMSYPRSIPAADLDLSRLLRQSRLARGETSRTTVSSARRLESPPSSCRT